MESYSRRCTKCAVVKPLLEFSKAPRGKYGHKSSCKACDAIRASANKESRRLPPGERERRLHARRGDTKQCSQCGEVKDRALFSKTREGKFGPILRSECKACQAINARDWYRNNPQRANDNRRRWSLKKEYGLSVEEYDAMLAQQGGVCAICGQDEPNKHGRTGTRFRLSVDHDHETGAVRSLLCQKCNRAIGLFDDDPERLQAAVDYLLRHREKKEF